MLKVAAQRHRLSKSGVAVPKSPCKSYEGLGANSAAWTAMVSYSTKAQYAAKIQQMHLLHPS